jgi:eukaryotic-like serine/threonine-protein kinase
VPFRDEPTKELGREPRARTAVADTPFLIAGSRLRDGRYVLERRLGRGGMAAVWLARDERLDRPVAIKVLSDTLAGDEDYLKRFRREARVAAGLTHPNLVNIYDFEAADRPYLVMEYVPGGDLGQRLATDRVPEPERLAIELLGALSHIHAAGVLHRDVKPQNVLLDADERSRLTDFGIAQPRDATSLTQTGQVLGTASYLAPEVLRGEAPSESSDLYSLGVVLAEATGDRPASAALLGLIDQLRAQDPADRPGLAAAALRELATAAKPPWPATDPTKPLAVPPEPAPAAADNGALEPGADGPVESGAPFEPGPFQPPEPLRRRRLAFDARSKAIGALALAVIAVALIVGVVLGGDDNPSGGGTERAASALNRNQDQGGGGDEQKTTTQAQEEQPPPAPSGADLNDQGYALIQQGRYDEAIPILQQALDQLDPSTLTYAYALYNLGHALVLAGRPEDAISILEQRLEYPDQTEVVQNELDLARREAGLTDDGGNTAPAPGNAYGHDKQKKEKGD